jgi:hypothetical protein
MEARGRVDRLDGKLAIGSAEPIASLLAVNGFAGRW